MSGKGKDGGSSAIVVYLRIRPSKNPSGFFQRDDLDPNRITFQLPDGFRDTNDAKDDYVNNSKLKHGFKFNNILLESITQEEVFKQVGANAVKNTIEGFNSTIFAYGQTGSGKTFTMTGGPTRYADRGLIPRSISTIFQEFRTRTDVQSKTYISYLEIYNERGYDLLDPSHETKALEDLPKVPTCLTS
jgi:kinesin family protein 6/9